jgi:hypothetical protein
MNSFFARCVVESELWLAGIRSCSVSVADGCYVLENAGWELLQRIHEAVQGPHHHIAACAPSSPAVSIGSRLSCTYSIKAATLISIALAWCIN